MAARSGFTLFEVCVVAALVALMALGLLSLWEVGLHSFNTAEAQTIVNEELRKAMDCIVDDVSEGGVSTITNLPADNAWYSSFSFRSLVWIWNGSPVWSANPVTYTVGGLNGMQLLRTNGTEQRVLANSILQFRVRRAPATPDLLEFSVRAHEDPLGSPPVESWLSVMVRVRN